MKYILAIDQSTAGTKVALMDETGCLTHVARRSHTQFHPAPGRVEHDAEEIWQNVAALLCEVAGQVSLADIAGIGISNQRETTVLWERATGKPVCHAVVWQDVRAQSLIEAMAPCADVVHAKTGLSLSPYYSAAKAAAVLREDPALSARAGQGEICIGTVDSYLLFRLTGGKFRAEVSNASRTQLMNLHTCCWDRDLTEMFGLPLCALAPEILLSDGNFGTVETIPALRGLPVLAMLGDSHAALFGHGCVEPGMTKATYGTGSSIMMNVGDQPRMSGNGLSASVAYGEGGRVLYALEGNVTSSADTLMWLKDEVGLISSMDDLGEAAQLPSSDGVYLVPAFSGLGAPWFDGSARALLYGMNRGTRRAHILYAALESIAQQNADVLSFMGQEAGQPVRCLMADGGATVNPLLMQLQSDLAACRVRVSGQKEMSLLGAALMAARHAGWPVDTLRGKAGDRQYAPQMPDEEREKRRQGWLDAVRRCR